MDRLIEAICRECALRMGIMIGDAGLPPGLKANVELRVRQYLFETTGGNHRDWQKLVDDPLTQVGRLMEESQEGARVCKDWTPQAHR